MENYEIGDLVKHKSTSQIMVVKGFSKTETLITKLRKPLTDKNLSYVVCEYVKDCNKKMEIFQKEMLEKIKDKSNS
ncbi:hypothetical protein FH587_19055 [Leptospira interrogans]|uniref:hypothetical protein n=1 Tax=Leptospira interrogans TaxID=173 RepID=UPI001F07FCF0|nr:hypothetical protein [Leptospira interrogans]UML84103.1 hypothetical protein FH587_19055 [Leptospira interrogans]